MSTPRTDIAWNEGFDPVILSAARLARRLRVQCAALERENAALRDALDCIAGNHGERSPVTLTEAQEEARAALSARKEAQP